MCYTLIYRFSSLPIRWLWCKTSTQYLSNEYFQRIAFWNRSSRMVDSDRRILISHQTNCISINCDKFTDKRRGISILTMFVFFKYFFKIFEVYFYHSVVPDKCYFLSLCWHSLHVQNEFRHTLSCVSWTHHRF